jgi:hypothetical protein
MGLFSPVIDKSPIDKYGQAGNANQLASYSNSAFMQAQQLWNPTSNRNQMFKQNAMEDAFDMQANQSVMSQRQAARSGQAFTPAGMDTSGMIRNQVQKNYANQMMAQQSLAGNFLSQASQTQAQSGSLRNSLNSLFRQRAQANQQARQQAKSAKLSLAGGLMGGFLGPSIGAIGGKLSEAIVPKVGGSGDFLNNVKSFAQNAGQGIKGGFGNNNLLNNAFSNHYGGGNFKNTFGGGYLDPNGVSVETEDPILKSTTGLNFSNNLVSDSISLW